MDKMKCETGDGVVRNVDKIAAMFPQVVTEVKGENGKITRAVKWDVLKELLSGEYVEGGECYDFTWPGKRAAIAEAARPIRKTLRPCKAESKDWDTTENLYIEGDNLEVLKLLQESYLGKVKMIYIDPPYNTGNDFVYRDNFKVGSGEYAEATGEVAEDEETGEKNRMFRNTEANGRFHSDWCSMIYMRLQVARDLLKDDGIIFISIDEHEIINIQKICDEIFGVGNDLGTIVWDKRNPKGEVAGVAQQHEYIVVYCKNFIEFNKANYFFRKKEHGQMMLDKAASLVKKYGSVTEEVAKQYKDWINSHKQDFSGGELAYCFIDERGQVYRPVSMAAPDKPETRSHRPLIHPITHKPCPVPAKGWRFPDASMDELLRKNQILFGADEKTQPGRKYLLSDNLTERVPSLLYFGGFDDAMGLPFDNPKPLYVISRLVETIGIASADVILDFFSGSATTAHAVMQLNAEDGGKRKFVMVQFPEECPPDSEAAKAGYANICEIGKERIRRAGEKIKEEAGLAAANLDVGFRVFKVADSNMKDVYYSAAEYKQDMIDTLVSNIKEDRTDLDLLYGCLLEWGVELSLPHTSEKIDGVTVHTVNGGDLIACFDPNIPESAIRTIAKRQPLRAVFRDSSFASAPQKINVEEIFKLLSPTTTIKVI